MVGTRVVEVPFPVPWTPRPLLRSMPEAVSSGRAAEEKTAVVEATAGKGHEDLNDES